jgi:hypothetical protein
MERLPPGIKIICAKDVMKHQHTQLKALGTPIVLVEADHSCQAARAASSDNMMGLERRCYLAEGAEVCLTMDVGAHVGLGAHAPGVVKKIVYEEGTNPPKLPEFVVVDFGESYRGESFFPGTPEWRGWVPVYPCTARSDKNPTHSRTMIPLNLAFPLCGWNDPGQT